MKMPEPDKELILIRWMNATQEYDYLFQVITFKPKPIDDTHLKVSEISRSFESRRDSTESNATTPLSPDLNKVSWSAVRPATRFLYFKCVASVRLYRSLLPYLKTFPNPALASYSGRIKALKIPENNAEFSFFALRCGYCYVRYKLQLVFTPIFLVLFHDLVDLYSAYSAKLQVKRSAYDAIWWRRKLELNRQVQRPDPWVAANLESKIVETNRISRLADTRLRRATNRLLTASLTVLAIIVAYWVGTIDN